MYILRLDDACSNWDRDKWDRMFVLLKKYNIKPIVAIIPNCEDTKLAKYNSDNKFNDKIIEMVQQGWIPALHGYNHKLKTCSGGINPVNNRSEFVGSPLETQKQKIRDGIIELNKLGIMPRIFVAPAHTFDENTLLALKSESQIKVISDTIATDIYYHNGFSFIPQQTGRALRLPFKTVTFCYHPNLMRDLDFVKLEKFIIKHQKKFLTLCLDEIIDVRRKKRKIDCILSALYFSIQKIRHMKENNISSVV